MNKAKIYYRDIGDYLSREEKLDIVRKMKSIDNLAMQWQMLSPNEYNDWINHRNDKFSEFLPLAPEIKFDGTTQSFFTTYAVGVNTGRDAWAYNFSKQAIAKNMQRMIAFYNEQSKLFAEAKQKNPQLKVEDFIDVNDTKISWTRYLRNCIGKSLIYSFTLSDVRRSYYRPFCKQNLYFNNVFNEAIGLSPIFFPTENITNIVICVSSSPNDGLSLLISDAIANLHFNGDTQCFPLYWYEETKQNNTLFDSLAEPESGYYARRDGISDYILNQARSFYGSKTTKEDVFYYVYGFLHNPDYRTMFAADLKKMLPRIPLVDDSVDFWKYVKAGRELARLHLDYESIEPYKGVLVMYNPLSVNDVLRQANKEEMEYLNYKVEKMRFPKKEQKDTIIYNSQITIENIPAEAYEYVVNGKSAIEWLMERYQITTHKESGIVNDPNDWAREHGKPRYILDLLLSMIAVSVRTVEVVRGLPKVRFN
jgi:predicted helicase